MKIFNCAGLNIKPDFQSNFKRKNIARPQVENKQNENDFYKHQSMVGMLNKTFVNSNAISFEGRKPVMTNEVRQQILDMRLKQNMTQAEIANATGFSRRTILNELKYAGLARRDIDIADKVRKQIISMYKNQEMSITEIADGLKMDVANVTIILQDAGLITTPMKKLFDSYQNSGMIPQKSAVELQEALLKIRDTLQEAGISYGIEKQILDMYKNQGMSKEEISLYLLGIVNKVLCNK